MPKANKTAALAMQHPFQSDAVAAKFAAHPAAAQTRLLLLRALVFNTAASTPGVGPPQQTLKWGEPAYLTALTGAGSTVRLDWKPKAPALLRAVLPLPVWPGGHLPHAVSAGFPL